MNFEEQVWNVIKNVREGIRTKNELKACGCDACMEALKRLEGK